MKSYWLLKTEPGTYSFADLQKEKKTRWSGIRNFQARNFMREMSAGDLALIYHTGGEKAVVGVAEITRAAYAEPDPDGGDWSQVDVKAVRAFPEPVELKRIKAAPALKDLPLIRHSRLSVMPITAAHYRALTEMGGL